MPLLVCKPEFRARYGFVSWKGHYYLHSGESQLPSCLLREVISFHIPEKLNFNMLKIKGGGCQCIEIGCTCIWSPLKYEFMVTSDGEGLASKDEDRVA